MRDRIINFDIFQSLMIFSQSLCTYQRDDRNQSMVHHNYIRRMHDEGTEKGFARAAGKTK